MLHYHGKLSFIKVVPASTDGQGNVKQGYQRLQFAHFDPETGHSIFEIKDANSVYKAEDVGKELKVPVRVSTFDRKLYFTVAE